MTQAPKTLSDELAEIDAIEWCGWADTEDGAIEVVLAPSEVVALTSLKDVAGEHGYAVVLADATTSDAFTWRLEVSS